jgi:CBS domain-containing protein
MTVGELIGNPVEWVEPDAPIEAVAEALTSRDIGALVVGNGERVDGVVSERDVVRAVATHRDLTATTALEVATTSLVWCDEIATVGEVAEEMMEHYIRHVLVERDGQLVGVVSARDLLGVFASAAADFDE